MGRHLPFAGRRGSVDLAGLAAGLAARSTEPRSCSLGAVDLSHSLMLTWRARPTGGERGQRERHFDARYGGISLLGSWGEQGSIARACLYLLAVDVTG